jgi:hypothetical protein
MAMKATPKRIRVLMLAGVLAAAAVPLGFALSLDSRRQDDPVAVVPLRGGVVSAIVPINGPVPLSSPAPRRTPNSEIPDTAKLLSMGTLLIGLAEVVRRAV